MALRIWRHHMRTITGPNTTTAIHLHYYDSYIIGQGTGTYSSSDNRTTTAFVLALAYRIRFKDFCG